MLQLHVLSWSIGIPVFLLSFICLALNQKKAHKVLQMVARLFFVLILISGIILLASVGFAGLALLKGILGIVLMGLMEMLVSRRRNGKPTGVFWILFFVVLGVILYIGFDVLK
jgi:uncharacterized membrane protein SirB2